MKPLINHRTYELDKFMSFSIGNINIEDNAIHDILIGKLTKKIL